MTRQILFVGAFLVASLVPSTAAAYCCWNKAICVAVCGKACCGSSSGQLTAGEQDALSEVSVKSLKTEIKQCKDADAFYGVLNDEIADRKGGAKPSRVR